MKRFTLLCLTVLAFAGIGYGQRTPCDAPTPTMAEMAAVQAAVEAFTPPSGSAPFTWQIPVRVTVCYKDNGTASFPAVTEAAVDNALAVMNAKMSVGTAGNVYNFHRCGRVNYVHVDEFNTGSMNIHAYSYAPAYLNLYFLQSPGNSFGNFPWVPGELGSTAFIKSGVAGTTVQHELGHTIGLYHTHHLNGSNYIIPPVPTQADYPDLATANNGSTNGNGLRESMINVPTSGEPFPNPNHQYAGDAVKDTPPGCDDDTNSQYTWPSTESLSPGCLDNDSNTPCINYCQSGGGPCTKGCAWDYTNCKYIGTYRDYNYDLIVDQMDRLAKNIMSYTGPCAQEFTPGQVGRADLMYLIYLGNLVQPQLCNTMDDKVEIKDTNTGMDRVSVKIASTESSAFYSRTVTNPEGYFTGQLKHEVATGKIKADVKLLGSNPDFTYTYDDWVKGVTTQDRVYIKRHILGVDFLDGYSQIAADVNKSGTVTTFDDVNILKLILGINQSFPGRDQPWAFIPEVVTIDKFTLQTHDAFNGGGNDNPFDMVVVYENQSMEHVVGAPYIESNWQYYMNSSTTRQGFDAVKLGNVHGSYPPLNDPCPNGDVVMVVPNVPIAMGEEFDLKVKGFNFSNIGAFQIGMAAASNDFEFVFSQAGSLTGFEEENGVGGLKYGVDGIKLLWMSNDLSPQSALNGSELLKVRLKAKHDIPSLQQLVYLDESVLESLFFTPNGDCVDNVSLELEADVVGVLGRSSNSTNEGNKMGDNSEKLFCYPNPANNSVNIVYDSEREFTGLVRFFDVHGRFLKEESVIFEKGRNIIKMDDLQSLPSGIVNIFIAGGSKLLSTRLMKF